MNRSPSRTRPALGVSDTRPPPAEDDASPPGSTHTPPTRRATGQRPHGRCPGVARRGAIKKRGRCARRGPSTSGSPRRAPSDRLVAALAGPDPDGLVDRADEDLSVTDAPGLGALLDGVDDLVREVVRHHDLQLDLGHEVHDVGRPSVPFLLAPRPSEALDLGHGHALDPDLGQGVLDLVQLERLDDGLDLLHGFLLRLTLAPAGEVAWPTPGPSIPSQGVVFCCPRSLGAVE